LSREWQGSSINLAAATQYYELTVDQGYSVAGVHCRCYVKENSRVSMNAAQAARYFKFTVDQDDSYGELNYELCLVNG
jgi:TPR repeat protein